MINFPTIVFLVIISIVTLLPPPTRSTNTPPTCEARYCRGSPEIAIEFPFQLTHNNTTTNEQCGYPGFEVTCNNQSQPSIKIPNSGDFVINSISLEQQQIWVNDPDECLAKRFLNNGTNLVMNSPFIYGLLGSGYVAFLNCTEFVEPELRIPCLSDGDEKRGYSVIVLQVTDDLWSKYYNSSVCTYVGYGMFPIEGDYEETRSIHNKLLHSDVMLKWFNPACACRGGQHCGFSSFYNGSDFDVICYGNDTSQGGSSPSSSGLSHKVGHVAWGIIGILFVSLWY